MAASSGAEDIDNSPAAYNQSIYVMVGVPYACFAIFGCLIYRGFRNNERYRRQMGYEDGNGDPIV